MELFVYIECVCMFDVVIICVSVFEGCELLFEYGGDGVLLTRLRVRVHRFADPDPRRAHAALTTLRDELPALGLQVVTLESCADGLDFEELRAVLEPRPAGV